MVDQFAQKYAFALEDDSSPPAQAPQLMKWDDAENSIGEIIYSSDCQPKHAEEIQLSQECCDKQSDYTKQWMDQEINVSKSKLIAHETTSSVQMKPVGAIQLEDIKKKNDALSQYFANLLSDSEEEETEQEPTKQFLEAESEVNEESKSFEQVVEPHISVHNNHEVPADLNPQREKHNDDVPVSLEEQESHQEQRIKSDSLEDQFSQHSPLQTPLKDEWQEEERKSPSEAHGDLVCEDLIEENIECPPSKIEEEVLQMTKPIDQLITEAHGDIVTMIPSSEEALQPPGPIRYLQTSILDQYSSHKPHPIPHEDTLVELSTEVSLEIEPFQILIEPSKSFIINQIKESVYKPESRKPKMTRAPKLFAFPHRANNLVIINRKSLVVNSIPLTQMRERCLMESLHDMVKLDPAKIANSEYARAKISSKIEEYATIANLEGGERKVWALFQSILTLKRCHELTPQAQLIQEHQEKIIEDILQGQSMREAFQNMQLSKNTRIDNTTKSCTMACLIDYSAKNEWAVSAESLVFEIMKTEQSSLSLLVATLLMAEKEKNEVFRGFIENAIPVENPLYSLLMIQIGQGDRILDKETTKSGILANWRLVVAFLLSNFKNPTVNKRHLFQFISSLADLILAEIKDVWGYCYLKLLTLEPFTLLHSSVAPSSSLKMNLSLNYLQTLSLPLTNHHDQEREHLELTYFRALIYSRTLGLHDIAHEEYHTVIENRETLLQGIPNEIQGKKGLSGQQYLQFMLRELKQQEFEWIRKKQGAEQKQLKQSLTEDKQREKEHVSDQTVDDKKAIAGESGFFTGLFKRVIGNKMQQTAQQHSKSTLHSHEADDDPVQDEKVGEL